MTLLDPLTVAYLDFTTALFRLQMSELGADMDAVDAWLKELEAWRNQ